MIRRPLACLALCLATFAPRPPRHSGLFVRYLFALGYAPDQRTDLGHLGPDRQHELATDGHGESDLSQRGDKRGSSLAVEQRRFHASFRAERQGRPATVGCQFRRPLYRPPRGQGQGDADGAIRASRRAGRLCSASDRQARRKRIGPRACGNWRLPTPTSASSTCFRCWKSCQAACNCPRRPQWLKPTCRRRRSRARSPTAGTGAIWRGNRAITTLPRAKRPTAS